MRIGYCVPGWPPGSVPNGIVTTYGHLGRQLREMGHEVSYIAVHAPGPVEDPWVTVLDRKDPTFAERIRLKLNLEGGLFRMTGDRIAAAVESLVRDKGIEIFQMEETQGWARAVIERVKIPVVVRLHGPWLLHSAVDPLEHQKPENRHRIQREGEAICRAAGITAPSKNVFGLTEAFYGPFKCPSEVIPNPIPVKLGVARWNFDCCDRNTILFVGRFDHHKGADILLKAFAKLAEDNPTTRLVFVGPDKGLPSRDGRCIKFAEFVANELPLRTSSRIEYRGLLPQSEIDKLRLMAHVTVACSRYENFGNTILEAMSTGGPIIATNTGGTPEIITNNRNGLLVPVEDVDGLAGALSRLLDEPDLARKLGNQAALDCSDWFDPKIIVQRTISYYERVL